MPRMSQSRLMPNRRWWSSTNWQQFTSASPSSRGGSHPSALTEPCSTASRYMALVVLIIKPVRRSLLGQGASARTCEDIAGRFPAASQVPSIGREPFPHRIQGGPSGPVSEPESKEHPGLMSSDFVSTRQQRFTLNRVITRPRRHRRCGVSAGPASVGGPDPVPQRLGVHSEISGDRLDRRSRTRPVQRDRIRFELGGVVCFIPTGTPFSWTIKIQVSPVSKLRGQGPRCTRSPRCTSRTSRRRTCTNRPRT